MTRVHISHTSLHFSLTHIQSEAGPKAFGDWGEGLFIFRELGSHGNYFEGSGE